MVNWFEDLSKTLGDDRLPRRQAMRRIAGSITGIALVSWLPGQALAKVNPESKQCPTGCGCATDCPCAFNQNGNCFCFFTVEGKGVCGCNTLCSQSPSCSSSSQCSKGYTCITSNGCTSCLGPPAGVCVPKCKGKHKNCHLGSGHGLTATGRPQ